MEENFKKQIGEEYAASRGEYLNGKIMAAYLGFTFVDPAEMIRFDGNGQFDGEITEKLVAKKLGNLDCAVVPGFYGAKEDGTIKTFSRGALTLPVLSWRELLTRISMRTGPMCPAFW